MNLLRSVALCGSAAMVAGGVTLAGAPAMTTAAPARAAHSSYHLPSTAFLHAARTALVHYLDHSHPGSLLVHPAQAHGQRGTTAVGSYNWSGYEDTSTTDGTFTKVSGSWTTPSVTCTAEDTITSEWVGIDGASSTDPTVEQDGTLGWCFEDVPTYYTWYEMYPAGTMTVGTTIKPGDKIAASVSRTGTSYTLALTDSTTSGNNVSDTATCAATTCLDTSAEWVAERPEFSIGIAPLAKFSKWTLSSASETANGVKGTISSYATNSSVTMLDATQSYDLSTVSGLTSGNKFSATWHNSY